MKKQSPTKIQKTVSTNMSRRNLMKGLATGIGVSALTSVYSLDSKGQEHGPLRDFVSVKDYGAVGDGTTDDSAAFQAAFNDYVGAIYVPSGHYVLHSQVVANQGHFLFGEPGSIEYNHST